MEFLKLSNPSSIQHQIRKTSNATKTILYSPWLHPTTPQQKLCYPDLTSVIGDQQIGETMALITYATNCKTSIIIMSYGERQWSQLQGKLPVNKACTSQHQAVGVSKIKQNPFHLSSKFKISKRKK
jgi:hypothetical protein